MKRIAVLDFETDGFKFGRLPLPFSWQFFNGEISYRHWESLPKDKKLSMDEKRKICFERCVKALLDFLEDLEEEHLIYAHNGGKFDFLFFIDKFEHKIRIVNGRILEAFLGKHTFRDSYAILPIPLKDYVKDDIDYKKMEPDIREEHKEEILSYLNTDCESLYKLVQAFVSEFGDVLTIGSASMKEFKKFHKFETASRAFDTFFRRYYFGGRCQCFETGIIKAPIKVFDVHSMYPSVMKKSLHPISIRHDINKRVNSKTAFVCWEGKNYGAVPTRQKHGLNFNVKDSNDTAEKAFFTTIHEFEVALETGTIQPRKIKHTIEFKERITFADFVDHFYNSRQIAKREGDKFHDIFYKLILNSSYGKFAQDPSDYVDSIILPWGEVPELLTNDIGEVLPDEKQFFIEFRHENYAIWSKPVERHSYYNVATAASITGAARSVLLRGIAAAERPLYCDTDSIFCTDFKGEIHETELGTWDLEKQGDTIAIAGKKLYALMDGDLCVKQASKGVKMTAEQIFRAAMGETIECKNDAPAFKLDGAHQFITRRVRMTA